MVKLPWENQEVKGGCFSVRYSEKFPQLKCEQRPEGGQKGSVLISRIKANRILRKYKVASSRIKDARVTRAQ